MKEKIHLCEGVEYEPLRNPRVVNDYNELRNGESFTPLGVGAYQGPPYGDGNGHHMGGCDAYGIGNGGRSWWSNKALTGRFNSALGVTALQNIPAGAAVYLNSDGILLTGAT